MERTRASFGYRFETTQEGGATVDADKLCELIFRAMDETLACAGMRHICGVGLSTFWHGILGVDRRGDPTTPVFTWADRRAADAAERLRERLDETAIHRSTGCMLHSSYLPAKLSWLSRAYPRQFEETTRWLSLGEYLYLKLFGDAAVGISLAAGTGLFAQNQRVWDTQLLNELPVDVEQLSPVSDEPMRGLRGSSPSDGRRSETCCGSRRSVTGRAPT